MSRTNTFMNLVLIFTSMYVVDPIWVSFFQFVTKIYVNMTFECQLPSFADVKSRVLYDSLPLTLVVYKCTLHIFSAK